MEIIITVNPGSTSTKIGLFSRKDKIYEVNIPLDEDQRRENVADEFDARLKTVEAVLEEHIGDGHILAVVGRGGPLKPLPGGVYRVNDKMLQDLRLGIYGSHASNLGAMLADWFGRKYGVPAFIIDPVTVDEFDPRARISGVPEIERKSRSHALNIRSTARKVCDREGWNFDETDLVVAHLGGGISVAALRKGRIRDVNDGLLGMGPFSPERAGALPIGRVAELAAASADDLDAFIRKLSRESGLKGYLGTADAKTVEAMISAGDDNARLIYDAMIYQILKEIGAMMAACDWSMKAVIVTGGLAYSAYIQDALRRSLKICPLIFFPGENELEAMADGGFRAIEGSVEIKEYA